MKFNILRFLTIPDIGFPMNASDKENILFALSLKKIKNLSLSIEIIPD